jgi:hypothetical protein
MTLYDFESSVEIETLGINSRDRPSGIETIHSIFQDKPSMSLTPGTKPKIPRIHLCQGISSKNLKILIEESEGIPEKFHRRLVALTRAEIVIDREQAETRRMEEDRGVLFLDDTDQVHRVAHHTEGFREKIPLRDETNPVKTGHRSTTR